VSNNSDAEQKDRELFNRIALNYSKKDIYSVSRSVRKFQIDTALNLLNKHTKAQHFENVLELGCGTGANSQYLKQYYKNYLGVDYSEELIRIADSLYSDDSTRFEKSDILSFNTKVKYDLIILVGVLHHLTELENNLKHILKTAHNKTYFIFLEPQGKNPLIQLMRVIRKAVDPSYSKTQMFFHRKELISLLESAGYKILEAEYTGYFSPPFAQVIMKPEFIFYPVAKVCITIDRFIQKYCPNSLSWNLTVIAEKRSEQLI